MTDVFAVCLILMYFIGVLLLVLWIEQIDRRIKKLETTLEKRAS